MNMKRISKVKFSHDTMASVSALTFIATLAIIVTFVNQFTFVNKHTRGITLNVKLSIKQNVYFYNVNTRQTG